MKKLLAILVALVAIMPAVLAWGGSGTIDGTIGVEDFPIQIWQCGERVVQDEDVQPWRLSGDGDMLAERNNNYIFEGETYSVDVLVMDKNKIDESVVDITLTSVNDPLDVFNLNCVEADVTFDNCNARIGEEDIESFDENTMQGYTCYIEIADSSIMYGEYILDVQAVDSDGTQTGTLDETSIWFVNPRVTLGINGDLDFAGQEIRPGTSSYDNVQVVNNAEGGVILDMFIVGSDWHSADPAQARCMQVDGAGVATGDLLNVLPLGAFRYYVENGAYSSRDDLVTDNGDYDATVVRALDTEGEGYLNIQRNLDGGFVESMFDEAEILQASAIPTGGYYANLLYPGSTGMTLTFRLNLPEPCYGTFDGTESMLIWGEAV